MHSAKPESAEKLARWLTWVGQRVNKKSGKPFKSTFKIATVKGTVDHPITKRLCFIFNEDDSFVECGKCQLNDTV